MTGASHPQVKKLGVAMLKKKARGTGNHLGFSADDALRIMVSRELLRVGVQVGSLRSLFASLETPSVPNAKRWAWLRTEDCRRQGAALVLVQPHALAPTGVGAVGLTTAAQAVEWLQSKRTVVVIDVGACIKQIEEHTGQSYIVTAKDAPQ
jgi:hypothetical protein